MTLVTDAQERLRTIAGLTRRLDRLHAPVEPMEPDPGPDAAAVLERLRLRDSELAERLGEARAHLEAAETTRAEARADANERSEEHTSELQSLMRISYAVFCLKKTKINKTI